MLPYSIVQEEVAGALEQVVAAAEVVEVEVVEVEVVAEAEVDEHH